MPEIFPVIEGDKNNSLTKDFTGVLLAHYYEMVISLAEAGGYKSINDFDWSTRGAGI